MPNQRLERDVLKYARPSANLLAGDYLMDLLMFVPLILFILISIGLGAITGAIGKRKNRSRALWWVAGAFGFPIALVSVLFFKNLEQIPDEKKPSSKLKEKIVLTIILVLWLAMMIRRIQAVI
jgi:hypothetical protein